MRIVIDDRPVKGSESTDPFFAIRLYPDTNEEMGKMEWGMEISDGTAKLDKVYNGSGDTSFHYVIVFEREKELSGKLTLYKGDEPKIDAMIDLLEYKEAEQKYKRKN